MMITPDNIEDAGDDSDDMAANVSYLTGHLSAYLFSMSTRLEYSSCIPIIGIHPTRHITRKAAARSGSVRRHRVGQYRDKYLPAGTKGSAGDRRRQTVRGGSGGGGGWGDITVSMYNIYTTTRSHIMLCSLNAYILLYSDANIVFLAYLRAVVFGRCCTERMLTIMDCNTVVTKLVTACFCHHSCTKCEH